MFKIKHWKFNKYCTMYAELFNEEVPHYDKVDYVSLQKRLVNKLKDTSFTDRQHIEVILKDNLHEFKDGGTDFKQFYGVIIGLFSGIASLYLKSFIDGGSIDSLSIFYVIFYVTIFFTVYTLIIDVVFNSRKIVKSGFYEWSLNLLDKYENGKFDKYDNNTSKTLNQVAVTVKNEPQPKKPVRHS